jgi:hypothetical protein
MSVPEVDLIGDIGATNARFARAAASAAVKLLDELWDMNRPYIHIRPCVQGRSHLTPVAVPFRDLLARAAFSPSSAARMLQIARLWRSESFG